MGWEDYAMESDDIEDLRRLHRMGECGKYEECPFCDAPPAAGKGGTE